jgi:hypothetical protein
MDRKIKGRRVALFFIFAIGSIALPTVGAYLFIWFFGIPKEAVEDFIGGNLGKVLAILLGYYLTLIPAWSYFGVWASRVDPKAGALPISKEDLVGKLLALNDPKLPWTIRRGEKEDLIAEWKIVDEKWVDIFAANRVSIVHKLRFRIDPKDYTVHVQDVERRVSWRVGVDGRPQATLRFSGKRGIDFYQYDWGAAYGVIYKDGQLKIDFAYNYKFNLQEMKNPLIEVATENGWTWEGAFTVSPFWAVIFGGR